MNKYTQLYTASLLMY